jgi:hypothetical protein
VHVALGAVGVPLLVPRKPNEVDPFAGIDPFQPALRICVVEPELPSRLPFQTCETLWPEGLVKVTVQPLTAELPAWTVPSAWNPPDHEFVMVTLTVQEPSPGPGVVGLLLGPPVGLPVGLPVGPPVGLPVSPMPVTSPLPPSNTTSEQLKKFSWLSERTQRM